MTTNCLGLTCALAALVMIDAPRPAPAADPLVFVTAFAPGERGGIHAYQLSIRDGSLKALGVTSSERSPLLPLVPTLVEQGIAGFEVNTWGGLVAPKGTSPEIVARLNGELIRILSNPDIKQTRLLQGFEFAPPLSPTAFAELISRDLARWVPLLKTTGVRAD